MKSVMDSIPKNVDTHTRTLTILCIIIIIIVIITSLVDYAKFQYCSTNPKKTI